MEEKQDFEDIRPLFNEEIDDAIAFLVQDPEFLRVAKFVLPDMPIEELKAQLLSCHEWGDFQKRLAYPFLSTLISKTATSLQFVGAERAGNAKAFTAISNHRDIVLDAALLNLLLYQAGLGFIEVAIGDNLLIHPWIEKLVRLNGCFIVKRGVSKRGQLETSKQLSSYIHNNITQRDRSVWIAQREGRAKDSNDRTQESIIKMLALGSDKNLIESLQAINIIPITLSYEYDPCDYLKAKEFLMKRDDPEYKKSPADDLLSMEMGILGYKGQIVFTMGNPLNKILPVIRETITDKSEQITAIAELIDREIHLNYHFYPVNYIAYDQLTGEARFTDYYTDSDKKGVEEYFQKQLNKIQIENKDEIFLRQKLYEMYANPLINHLNAKMKQ
ncbi:MAG: 1-acyl-sn-glycerol-3-phosphate acyltransferase [Bacteroidales bacterium]|nr:1-acyl-sn-glycerol-3-phosphate acyltransferase [Bacteroidales bacterium]